MKKDVIKKKIPEIKKNINAFLVGEDGKISKQSVIKAGVLLGAISLGTVQTVIASHASTTPHSNTLGSITYDSSAGSAEMSHTHHTSHSNTHTSHSASHTSGGGGHTAAHSAAHSASHGSHGSHGSHSQW